MNRHDVRLLQAIRDYPSVSIILPTYRTAPENQKDPIRVKNLVKEAENRLLQEFTWREIDSLTSRLNDLVEHIDYQYTTEGLAIYVNKDFARAFALPFKPVEQVVVGETFATRNLVLTLNRTQRYWVLALSDNTTRLFEGVRDSLVEITESGFPMANEGPGAATRLPGGQGINRSAYRDEKNREFYSSVDTAFKEFMIDDELPLVVAGVDRNLAFFQEVSSHTSAIIGTLRGNYDKTPAHELANLVWPLVKANRAVQVDEVLSELDAAISARRYAASITEVWQLSQEGRGSILIVETGFHYPARVDETGLFLTPAEDATAPDVIDDTVDDVIEAVMSKGGKVVFVDDGVLEKYQHIAMILRY
jgi:hypothetical protein